MIIQLRIISQYLKRMDKINVIVPCHNYANYLDLCLMSIFTQRIDCTVEILFSDDNSKDESLGIAERIAKRYNNDNIFLKIFSHKDNLGELNNTRFLLSQCDGKYIAYLDADDYWIDPFKLQKQYNFMKNNEDYSMCYTGQIGFDGTFHQPDPKGFDNIIAPYHFIRTNEIYFDIHDYAYGTLDVKILCDANHVFSSSRFFRNYKDLFQDYFYEFPYSDWPMNFELGLRGKIHYMNFASYVYRIKTNSLFHSETSSDWDKNYSKRTQLLYSLLNKK